MSARSTLDQTIADAAAGAGQALEDTTVRAIADAVTRLILQSLHTLLTHMISPSSYLRLILTVLAGHCVQGLEGRILVTY